MNFTQARHQFYRETQKADESIDLAKASLAIAQEEYPSLKPEIYLAQLDTMAAAVKRMLPERPYPLRVIGAINAYLYKELGFHGNTSHYYDPRNSYLNEVLERRTGIPISLSLVYLEIARRIGFPMVGVNFPAHFLIRPEIEGVEFWVDPFNEGAILFRQDCEEKLLEIFSPPISLEDIDTDPISNRDFISRMLLNLKGIYLRRERTQQALAASERLLILNPDSPAELRDRGVLYFRQERWIEAREDLSRYLRLEPGNTDRDLIKAMLDAID